MYKVFFNDSFIGFTNKEEDADSAESTIHFDSFNPIQNWLNDAERLLKPANTIVLHPKPELVWQDFKLNFKVLKAAGGLVLNSQKEFLFIYKKGKWDLPKGKMDKGEEPCDTAVREVCEETGLSKIKIIRDLVNTYHIYRHKEKLILKKTYWFLIKNNGPDELTIQKEEHIESASWVKTNDLLPILENSYGSINDVFRTYRIQENL